MAGIKLKKIEDDFYFPLSRMRKVISDFHREMKQGLAGKKSSMTMIPTYVDCPSGNERGRFLALDLGGTNFRILELELAGRGVSRVIKIHECKLDDKHIKGDARAFFDFIAVKIKKFIGSSRECFCSLKAGFTFSFPVKQTAVNSGTLLRWTKGFSVGGVINKDVVKLLNESLERNGVYRVEVDALANDTVGTLMSLAYKDRSCDVGVILGTGTNACYREKLSKIAKWKDDAVSYGHMIVNTECGNFNKLPRNFYDRLLDRLSDRPGKQILEKMVSGMYLGEIVRLAAFSLIKRGLLFKGAASSFQGRGSFKTEYMSLIEKDASPRLLSTARLLKKIGIPGSTHQDREILKKMCTIVSKRASRISASVLSAIITKIDPGLSLKHTIAVDGSLYEKHPLFSKNLKSALKEVFGRKAGRIRIELAKDGSGKGAAIIAAVAGLNITCN